jgi:hypothetical protein
MIKQEETIILSIPCSSRIQGNESLTDITESPDASGSPDMIFLDLAIDAKQLLCGETLGRLKRGENDVALSVRTRARNLAIGAGVGIEADINYYNWVVSTCTITLMSLAK